MGLGGIPELYVRRLFNPPGGSEQLASVVSALPVLTFSQVVYSLETAAAYSVGHRFHGLANNSMTDEQRMTLEPSSHEYSLRVGGSKLQLIGWSLYTLLLWLLKLCMLGLYTRLT